MPSVSPSNKADERSRGRGPRLMMALFSSWVLPSKSSSPSRKSSSPKHGRSPTSSSESSGSTAGYGGRVRAGSGAEPSARVPQQLHKAPATIASRAGRAEQVPLNAALYSPDSSLPTYGRPSSSHRRPVPPGLSPSPHVPYDVPRHSFDSRPGTKDARHLDLGVYPPNRAPPSLSAKPIQLAKSTPNLVGAVQAPTTAPRNIPRKAPPPYLPPSSNAHAPAASEPSPLLFVRPPTTARPGSSNGRLQSGPNGDSSSSAGRDGPRPGLPIGPPPQARLRPEIRHKKSHSTVHEREVVEDDDLPPLPPPQHRTLPMPHREGLQPRPRTSSRVDAPTKPRSKRRHLAVRPATADNADISRKKQSWRGQWNVDDIEEVRRRLREL
ncbi:hypothetical protein EV122DRAFT_273070 [Schizophyllum commune]